MILCLLLFFIFTLKLRMRVLLWMEFWLIYPGSLLLIRFLLFTCFFRPVSKGFSTDLFRKKEVCFGSPNDEKNTSPHARSDEKNE